MLKETIDNLIITFAVDDLKPSDDNTSTATMMTTSDTLIILRPVFEMLW